MSSPSDFFHCRYSSFQCNTLDDVMSSIYHGRYVSPANRNFRFMKDKIMPLSEAVQGYDEFNRMLHQKVIFEPGK